MTIIVPADRCRESISAVAARLAPCLGIAFAVVLLDQASKSLATRFLGGGDVFPITPFADLVLAHNRGVAFSFLADASGWQRWLFTALAIAAAAFIIRLLVQPSGTLLFRAALALVLGGALGNAIDRSWQGHVVDFIHLYWREVYDFAIFNVADCAITAGAALLVLTEFRRSRAA